MIRLGCVPWILSIGFLIGGGQSLYTGLSNRTITEISITELANGPPDAKWLRVTGGYLDVIGSVYLESKNGAPKEMYIPVIEEISSKEPIRLILHTKNPKLMNHARKAGSIDESTSEDEMMLMTTEILGSMLIQRDVEGIVEFGFESGKGDDKAKSLIKSPLADDCLLLEDGREPSALFGAILFSVGFALFIGMVKFSSREKKPPSLPPSPHDHRPLPLPGRPSGFRPNHH